MLHRQGNQFFVVRDIRFDLPGHGPYLSNRDFHSNQI